MEKIMALHGRNGKKKKKYSLLFYLKNGIILNLKRSLLLYQKEKQCFV